MCSTGVTRALQSFRIADDPPLYVVDTPGVMVPRVDSAAVGLRLALTAAVPDTIGELNIGRIERVCASRVELRQRAVTRIGSHSHNFLSYDTTIK